MRLGKESVKINPYALPIRRVILRGVPPFITNEEIEEKLRKFGELRSPIQNQTIFGVEPAFEHILSFTRVLELAIPAGNIVPDTLIFKHGKITYKIQVQIGAKKCFSCGKKGHTTKTCKTKAKKAEERKNQQQTTNSKSNGDDNLGEKFDEDWEEEKNTMETNETETEAEKRGRKLLDILERTTSESTKEVQHPRPPKGLMRK